MTESSNDFEKDAPSVSSNSFSQNQVSKSSNSFSKDLINKGSLAWGGEHLTSGPPPGDFLSGPAPGIGESGGIGHKNRRTPAEIDH